MAFKSNIQDFFDHLIENFKGFINSFRHFNRSNIGALVAYLVISSIGALALGYFLSWILSGLGYGIYLGSVMDMFFRYSLGFLPLLKYVMILSVAVFAMMIKSIPLGSNITLSERYKALTTNQKQNIAISLGILFGSNMILALTDPWYLGAGSDIFSSSPNEFNIWAHTFLTAIINLIPFYLSALIVHLGDAKFKLYNKEKAPAIFAGMILFMAMNAVILQFSRIISFQFEEVLGIYMRGRDPSNILNLLIISTIAVFTLSAKARSLGYNSEEESFPDLDDIPDTDILDDL